MQMSYLYASDFPFKTFCKLAQHGETIRKKCLRVQTTINHFYILTFLCFLPQYQRQRKCVFFFRARAEKGIARHIDASSVVRTLVIFDWFVLSMRMQVILDSAELKNAKGYVTAQRMGTWAQARAGLKWLRFGGKLIFGI